MMSQFILTITTGTPEYSGRKHLDHCFYSHVNQVFDSFAHARSALKSAVVDFAKMHTDLCDQNGQRIFEKTGLLRYEGEPVGWRKTQFDYVRDFTIDLLSDPCFESEMMFLQLVCSIEYLDPGYVVFCDEETFLIALDAPAVSVQYNIHDMMKENQYYYLTIRVGDANAGGTYEAFSVSLCPVGDAGVQEKRYPLLESLRREKELIKRAALLDS